MFYNKNRTSTVLFQVYGGILMGQTDKKKSKDFNIYYLNFSKVYEIAMMINNVILTKIETDNTSSFEEQYGFTSSISAQGTKKFLDGIKAALSSETKETATSSTKVVESLDVKTTKSILLRRVIEQCANIISFADSSEGDLIKIDRVRFCCVMNLKKQRGRYFRSSSNCWRRENLLIPWQENIIWMAILLFSHQTFLMKPHTKKLYLQSYKLVLI